MPQTITEILTHSPVIPVLVIERIDDAVPLAGALLEGGLGVLEVTLRSPVALEAAEAIKTAFPHAIVGMGTVTTTADFQLIASSSLDFGVSPGTSPGLLDTLIQQDFPFLPGVATVSEAMALHEEGMTALKFFPAEASGGIGFLKSVQAVLPGISFCPTGGIHAGNAADYLALPNVAAVGGSWIAPTDLIRAQDWPEIATRARKAALIA